MSFLRDDADSPYRSTQNILPRVEQRLPAVGEAIIAPAMSQSLSSRMCAKVEMTVGIFITY
jgi:hypothetical protein